MNPYNQTIRAVIIKLDDRKALGYLQVDGIITHVPFSFADLASDLAIPDLHINQQVWCEVDTVSINHKIEIRAKHISQHYREKQPRQNITLYWVPRSPEYLAAQWNSMYEEAFKPLPNIQFNEPALRVLPDRN